MPDTSQELTQPEAPKTPEAQLLATVQAAGIRELASTANADVRLMLADLSVGLTKAAAVAAPKLFQLNRRIGEKNVVKLLVAILRAFVDSVRVPNKPDSADIIDIAEYLAQTYTHDSLKDVILALKEARTNGTKFYQALDPSTIYGLISDYFDRKASFLENRHLDQKATGTSQQAQDVQLLGEAAPKMLEAVAQRIQPNHPNAEAMRAKLTITNQREKRGIITKKQAQQQRAEARAANVRKDRPDWKANPEAQAAIDKRHAQQNREIMDRYRL